MTTKSPRQGDPGERAKAAIDVIWQRYDQQVADLEKAADLAEEIAEIEDQLGVLAAWLQEGGMSMSDLANCIGVHPNRLHRLIDRHNRTTDD